MGVVYEDGSMSSGGGVSPMDSDITWTPPQYRSTRGLHLEDDLAGNHIRTIQNDPSRYVRYRVRGIYGNDEGVRDLIPLNGADTLEAVAMTVKHSAGLPEGRGFQLFIDKGEHPSVYAIPVKELVDTINENVVRKLGSLHKMCTLRSKGKIEQK